MNGQLGASQKAEHSPDANQSHALRRPQLVGHRASRLLCVALVLGAWLAAAWPAVATAVPWSLATPWVGSGLHGVSCTSSTACTAVGEAQGPSAARWDGTEWLRETPVNPAPDAPNLGELAGVACISSDDCFAVGHYQQQRRPFQELPLVERWDGANWSIQATPRLPSAVLYSGLSAISCVSHSGCVAVGALQERHRQSALIERWDGTRWSIQKFTSPNGSGLSGVSCASSHTCMAVGSRSAANGTHAVAARWDGAGWVIQSTAGTGFGVELRSVSCTSSQACTAVGDTTGPDGPVRALAERWDGNSWSRQRTSDLAVSMPELDGVSCTTATGCVAVGWGYASQDLGAYSRTLAVVWNGSAWKLERTPNARTDLKGGSYLHAVSCTPGLVCTAVGNNQDDDPLMERRAVPPGFTVSQIRTLINGTIKFNVKVPRPGRVDVLATAWKDNLAHSAVLLQPASGRFVFARKQIRATRANTISVTVVPNHRGKLLVAHHGYRVVLRLWISYTPRGQPYRSIGFYGLHLATS